MICNTQGSVDKGRRVQSKRSDGSLLEQLEVMHQPLDGWDAGDRRSRPAQQEAPAEAGASVMQMCASMARKPHWQKGKPGAPAQPPALCLTPKTAVLLSAWELCTPRCSPRGRGISEGAGRMQPAEMKGIFPKPSAPPRHQGALLCRPRHAIHCKGLLVERSRPAEGHGGPARSQPGHVGGRQQR